MRYQRLVEATITEHWDDTVCERNQTAWVDVAFEDIEEGDIIRQPTMDDSTWRVTRAAHSWQASRDRIQVEPWPTPAASTPRSRRRTSTPAAG